MNALPNPFDFESRFELDVDRFMADIAAPTNEGDERLTASELEPLVEVLTKY